MRGAPSPAAHTTRLRQLPTPRTACLAVPTYPVVSLTVFLYLLPFPLALSPLLLVHCFIHHHPSPCWPMHGPTHLFMLSSAPLGALAASKAKSSVGRGSGLGRVGSRSVQAGQYEMQGGGRGIAIHGGMLK